MAICRRGDRQARPLNLGVRLLTRSHRGDWRFGPSWGWSRAAAISGLASHAGLGWVAFLQLDFIGPLPYPGYPNQYYRPALPGFRVPIVEIAIGQNLMRP